MRSAPGHVGAFFDVDKTILAENSGTAYLKSLYERGEIDWKSLLFGLGTYLRYKLNLLDIERWVERNGVQFRGRSEESLEREVGIQQGSAYDPRTAQRLGRQLGAQYFFTGKITSVDERLNNVRRVQYTLFLQVIDVETGLIRFQNEVARSKALKG